MDQASTFRPSLALLLRVIYQHHSQAIESALRAAGFDDIAPSAGNVFPFMRDEGITISELAELAGVRKQTMAQAVEQLERSGYVERRENPEDRRSRLVFLTERGRTRDAGDARRGGRRRTPLGVIDRNRRTGAPPRGTETPARKDPGLERSTRPAAAARGMPCRAPADRARGTPPEVHRRAAAPRSRRSR